MAVVATTGHVYVTRAGRLRAQCSTEPTLTTSAPCATPASTSWTTSPPATSVSGFARRASAPQQHSYARLTSRHSNPPTTSISTPRTPSQATTTASQFFPSQVPTWPTSCWPYRPVSNPRWRLWDDWRRGWKWGSIMVAVNPAKNNNNKKKRVLVWWGSWRVFGLYWVQLVLIRINSMISVTTNNNNITLFPKRAKGVTVLCTFRVAKQRVSYITNSSNKIFNWDWTSSPQDLHSVIMVPLVIV